MGSPKLSNKALLNKLIEETKILVGCNIGLEERSLRSQQAKIRELKKELLFRLNNFSSNQPTER